MDPKASERSVELESKEVSLNEEDIFKGTDIKLEGNIWIPPSERSFPSFYMQTSLIDGIRLSSVDFKYIDKEFILEEQIGTIQWNVQTEIRDINGFNCQKAIGSFGGRDYIVWYTTEIPVTVGPWKLDGLPGALVEGWSQDGRVNFSLSKILYNMNRPDVRQLKATSDNIINCIDFFKFAEQNDKAFVKHMEARLPRKKGVEITFGEPKRDDIQKECH
ncbi:MAG: GLPGLI family protein [Flavobacteriaceae bacterium]|nr:GLPGLI family protein [Flavobacteriaceae bacterium]MCY4267435.1 GLPGLI family protein [Flavobacteriaceae bacterium]